MNEAQASPESWSDKTWLGFLLLAAADADGHLHRGETRYIRAGIGSETMDSIMEVYAQMSGEDREAIIRDQLPKRLQSQKARAKLQKLLRDIFMADGEYGPEEQAMTKRIGNWIRGTN